MPQDRVDLPFDVSHVDASLFAVRGGQWLRQRTQHRIDAKRGIVEERRGDTIAAFLPWLD